MTIPKRDKRRRGKASPSASPKEISFPAQDKMVHNYTRQCPVCGRPSYSTICDCGRLTLVTKGG